MQLLSSTLAVKRDPAARLGRLFVSAGFITETQLNEVLSASLRNQAQFGESIVMSGHVNTRELEAAFELQALLRSNRISVACAAETMRIVRYTNTNLHNALEKLSVPAANQYRLGDVLLQGRVISQSELNEALRRQQATSLPLGKILILSGLVNEHVIGSALTAQNLLNRGRISLQQALRIIVASLRNQVVGPVAGVEAFLEGLLLGAHVIDGQQYKTAARMALRMNYDIHEALVELKLVPAKVMSVVRQLEALADDEAADISLFIDMVKDAHRVALAIDQSGIPRGAKEKETEPRIVADSQKIKLARLCAKLVENKEMPLDKAVFAVRFCCGQLAAGVSLPDAYEKLGSQHGIWTLLDMTRQYRAMDSGSTK